MIQFNLIPDVKKQYMKTKRTKRLIMTISMLVSIGCIVIVLTMFGVVQQAQKGHISALTDDINQELNTLNSVDDLDKILTIQNQLTQLPALHQQKPETSRIFDYITRVTPKKVTVSSLTLSMTNNTMTISGRTDTLATVNKFADTLKFSTYSIKSASDLEAGAESSPEKVKAFTNVITKLSRDENIATYTIDFAFDPLLFNNTLDIELEVPNIISTRSSTNKPDEQLPVDQDVFDDSPEPGNIVPSESNSNGGDQ